MYSEYSIECNVNIISLPLVSRYICHFLPHAAYLNLKFKSLYSKILTYRHKMSNIDCYLCVFIFKT